MARVQAAAANKHGDPSSFLPLPQGQTEKLEIIDPSTRHPAQIRIVIVGHPRDKSSAFGTGCCFRARHLNHVQLRHQPHSAQPSRSLLPLRNAKCI